MKEALMPVTLMLSLLCGLLIETSAQEPEHAHTGDATPNHLIWTSEPPSAPVNIANATSLEKPLCGKMSPIDIDLEADGAITFPALVIAARGFLVRRK